MEKNKNDELKRIFGDLEKLTAGTNTKEECPILANKCPMWEKLTLTVAEAVEYSGIGENTIRRLARAKGCTWALYVGRSLRIKRKAFDNFINNANGDILSA